MIFGHEDKHIATYLSEEMFLMFCSLKFGEKTTESQTTLQRISFVHCHSQIEIKF